MAWLTITWKLKTNHLDDARRNIDPAVRKALKRAASEGEAAAKARTPVATGAAVASIKAKIEETSLELSLNTRSGYFSEVGGRGQPGKHMLVHGTKVAADVMDRARLDVL